VTGSMWFLSALATLLGGYGLLNLLAPAVTWRWQRSSTSRSRDKGHRYKGHRSAAGFGDAVAQAVGRADDVEPDRRTRSRVRAIGLVEILLAGGGFWFIFLVQPGA
jgi:hypothetical protein